MKKLTCIVIIAGLFFSCSQKEKPKPAVLSEKKMAEVMWDLMRADQYVTDFLLRDSTKNKKTESVKLYEEIFRIHHITADQFKKSLSYYQSDPAYFRPIIDSLARKQREIIEQRIHPLSTDSLIKPNPQQ